MGGVQSQEGDDGPITLHTNKNTGNNNIADEVSNNTLQPGYRFTVPSINLCAIDSGVAAPVFAQIQQLLWSYDEILHQKQEYLAKRMTRSDNHMNLAKAALLTSVQDAVIPVTRDEIKVIREASNCFSDQVEQLTNTTIVMKGIVERLKEVKKEKKLKPIITTSLNQKKEEDKEDDKEDTIREDEGEGNTTK